MRNKKYGTIKAKTTGQIALWTLIFTIAACAGTFASVGLNYYVARYQVNANQASAGWSQDFKFSATTGEVAYSWVPSKGRVKYGWSQEAGNSSCQYHLMYKKSMSSLYSYVYKNYTFPVNKTPSALKNGQFVDGATKYDVKVKKVYSDTQGKDSRVQVDCVI